MVVPAESISSSQSMAVLVDYACPLCEGTQSTMVYEANIDPNQALKPQDFNCTNPGHGEHFRIVRCNSCGMCYCTPRPSPECIVEAYENCQDDSYIGEEEGRIRTFQLALQKIGNKSGRLLDIGCHTGVFLEEAKKLGYQVFGVEPSEFSVKRCREVKGLDVTCGAVPCELPWKEPFDVVTLWDVIEHVDQPLELCKFVASRLRKGGEFHLSTMDVGALYPKIVGERWPWYMRMHIHYFSKRTVRTMLERAGFTVQSIHPYPHVIHESYLREKLQHLSLPLKLVGKIGAAIFTDKDGFVPVDMKDMMHVVAVRQ